MKKGFLYLILLLILGGPKVQAVYGYNDTDHDGITIKSDARDYNPAPAIYQAHQARPGDTVTFTFTADNNRSYERTVYGFLGFGYIPVGCGNLTGWTDHPENNPGAGEETLVLDSTNRNCQLATDFDYANGSVNSLRTFTIGAADGETGHNETPITFTVTIPPGTPSGYYQYDIGFGPLCEPNGNDWQDINQFRDFACAGNGELAAAGFIRVVNDGVPSPSPSPTPTPSPYTQNLDVNCSVSPVDIVSGSSYTWAATSNLSSGVTYAWEDEDGRIGTGASVSKTYFNYGTSSVTRTGRVTASTAGYNSSTKNCATLTIDPLLTVSCSPSPSSVLSGSSITWTANTRGGSGSYTYSWSGTDGLSGTGVSVVKSYTNSTAAPVIKSASVMVTSGSQAYAANCAATIYPTFSASCSASWPGSSSVGHTGDIITWTASPSDPAYTYSWSGTDGLSGTTYKVNKVYPIGGYKTANLTVRNTAGQAATASCTEDIKPGAFRIYSIDTACDGTTPYILIKWTPYSSAARGYKIRRLHLTSLGWQYESYPWTISSGVYEYKDNESLTPGDSYKYEVQWTDGSGWHPGATSSEIIASRCPPFIRSCTSSKTLVYIGESLTYGMSVAPGSYSLINPDTYTGSMANKYYYSWHRDATGPAFSWTTSLHNINLPGSYPSTGTGIMWADIYYGSSGFVTKQCNPVSIIKRPPTITSCTPSVTTARVGQSLTYTMVVDPGDYAGDFNYSWEHIGIAPEFDWTNPSLNTNVLSGSFPSAGTGRVKAAIYYGGAGGYAGRICDPVTVTTILASPSPSASPPASPPGSSAPFIQTTGGDVHSNTRIQGR